MKEISLKMFLKAAVALYSVYMLTLIVIVLISK